MTAEQLNELRLRATESLDYGEDMLDLIEEVERLGTEVEVQRLRRMEEMVAAGKFAGRLSEAVRLLRWAAPSMPRQCFEQTEAFLLRDEFFEGDPQMSRKP